jgi:ABC-type uncharacterized transport system auxiliary subunit
MALRHLARCAGLVAAVTLSGCGLDRLFGRRPALELYRLVPPAPAPQNGSAASHHAALPAGALAVQPYITSGVYEGDNLLWRQGDLEYGFYPNKQWALPLGEMLGRLTESTLRDAPLTSGLVAYDPQTPRRQLAYRWRGTVREFEEVIRERQVYAAVTLDAQLLRASDDSVIWTGSKRLERPVPRASTHAIVRALSELAAESVRDLAADARVAVARQAGVTPREPR